MQIGSPFVIHKCDHTGRRVLAYTGSLIAIVDDSLSGAGGQVVCIEATFALPDKDAGYHIFRRGDRFVEWFYTRRGYNIFALYDADDGRLKGWYCNITRPARLLPADQPPALEADDLALDLFIDPAGGTLLLDEDEFAALDLSAADRSAARAALAALYAHLDRRETPFDSLQP